MIIYAPFTEQQIQRLKEYQDSGKFHPYTCSNGHILIPEKEGLRCYACNFNQIWCHDFSLYG